MLLQIETIFFRKKSIKCFLRKICRNLIGNLQWENPNLVIVMELAEYTVDEVNECIYLLYMGDDLMQALMLAAGMGRRLGKYTEAMPKCMIRVGGKTLLERAVEALKEAGIHKFVMVVGWERDMLIDYIQQNISGMEFEFIYNYDYAETNNIYSLYMAREQLAADDTILLESDLVYDKRLICEIVAHPGENLVAVAQYEQWMDGTVTTLDEDGMIHEFIDKKHFRYENVSDYFKTVNIYKFSKTFSQRQYIPFLEAYIKAYGKNQYYELVLKALAHLSNAHLEAFVLQNERWYEIDDVQDLDIANTLFAQKEEALLSYERHFGGYWRFPGLRDFCYLVNPYFPPQKMLDQMKYFYEPLLTQYPSGMSIQKLMAGKIFSVDEDFLLVGNGAAELINVLGETLKGKLAISVPAFNEYIRCFKNCEIFPIGGEETDFQLNEQRLCDAAMHADVLAIINPDNPSGSFLRHDALCRILDVCEAANTTCIVDESFIDFAEPHMRYSLLRNDILKQYPNLIVIKSISKSYGVPGLRLGVLASSKIELIGILRQNLPVWNINSFAEYFLQIFSLYKSSYLNACTKIANQRRSLQEKLTDISFLKVYPSQANYIMCEVTEKYRAKDIATRLIMEYNLLIKDLSEKSGFHGRQFIRIAVKDHVENEALYQALKALDT